MLTLAQYPGTAFKIPMLSQWLIIISGPQMMEDIRRATPEQVDAREVIAEVCGLYENCRIFQTTHSIQAVAAKYTMGPELQEHVHHVAAVRSPLTKNLAVRFAEVQDEITCAFNDFIPATQGWYYDEIEILIIVAN